MRNLRAKAGPRPESSLLLVLVYACFALLSPTGQDALPKGQKLRYGAYPPAAGSLAPASAAASIVSGLSALSAVAAGSAASLADGGIWIDDEQDACHSSPADRKSDDASPFALLDSESPVRGAGKCAASGSPISSPFPHAAATVSRAVPAGGPEAACYLGPSLPFAAGSPVFLISDLPPPLPA